MTVSIETNDRGYKPGAKIILRNPERLDEWDKQVEWVRNKEVSVCVGNSDGWLCVAKLPLTFSDEEFVQLAGAYGKVKEAFLMVSEETGNIICNYSAISPNFYPLRCTQYCTGIC